MEKLIEKVEEIKSALAKMSEQINPSKPKSVNLHNLRRCIEIARLVVLEHGVQRADIVWHEWFIKMGSIAMQILESNYQVVPIKEGAFANFLLEKHRLYGVQPLINWGEVGILMRMDSKTERVLNMMNQEYSPSTPQVGESIIDSLMDILGYCILGYYFNLRITGVQENEH